MRRYTPWLVPAVESFLVMPILGGFDLRDPYTTFIYPYKKILRGVAKEYNPLKGLSNVKM